MDNKVERYTIEELRAMRDAGETETRPDAPENDMDDEFWAMAQLLMEYPQ